MARIKKDTTVSKEVKIDKTPVKVEKELNKEELLEYHLGRLPWNSLSKQEVRAIFQSLFR